MTDKPLPAFRSISRPLDVADADLDRINDTLGVPTLSRPSRSLPKTDAKPQPAASDASLPAPAAQRATAEKLTVEVPPYLMDALRRDSVDKRVSMRHVVMLALKRAGFHIEAADLVPDGRRTKVKP